MHIEEIDVSEEMEILRRRMKKKGLKSTPQRDEFARMIFQSHDHFTVDELINTFRERGQKVSHATAYRVVQMMLDLELLAEHDFGKGIRYFEHTPGHPHHDHLICQDCGGIFEFIDEKLEKRKLLIAKERNFKIINHALTIFGICSECKKDPNSSLN